MFARHPHLQTIVTDEGSVDLIKRAIAIEDWVSRARAYEILMTLPCAMRSISCHYPQNLSFSAVLEVARKHGPQLRRITFVCFEGMTADAWLQLWVLCPNLKLIRNAKIKLDITARSFEQTNEKSYHNPLSPKEIVDILLTVPVTLQAIRFNMRNPTLLTPAEILAVAAKHGATLKKWEIRLHVEELGICGLEHFLQLCPELNCLDLSHADAASLDLVAKHCTRTLAKLTVRDGQQRVTDAAVVAVLLKHPQLTELTLIDCTGVTSAVLDHIDSMTKLSIVGDSGIGTTDTAASDSD